MLALGAVIGAFLVLGTIKASRNLPKAAPTKPIDINALIDPKFRVAYWDAKGDAALRRMNEEWRDISLIPRADPRPHYLRLLEAMESPTIQDAGGSLSWPYSPRGIPSSLLGAIHQGDISLRSKQVLVDRAYIALLTLFPKVESNPGSTSVEFAGEAVELARDTVPLLYKDHLSATRLERVLKSMPEEVPPRAEEGFIRNEITRNLPAALINQGAAYVMAPLGENGAHTGGPLKEVDVVQMMRLAQEVASETIKDMHRPRSQQAKKERKFRSLLRSLREKRPSFENPLPSTQKNNETGLRILASHMGSITSLPSNYATSINTYQASRTLLGLAVYEARHGKMPDTLDELLRDGILEELPLDAFTQKPFGYSARFKAVFVSGEPWASQTYAYFLDYNLQTKLVQSGIPVPTQ